MLDDEQKLQLIKFMERNPCFWDKSDINYLNSATKGLMFSKLARTIGTSEREVKSGWKSLKKSYLDEKLRQTTRTGNRTVSPLFPYYGTMLFLEKSGDRSQPKTFSNIPAFRQNETAFATIDDNDEYESTYDDNPLQYYDDQTNFTIGNDFEDAQESGNGGDDFTPFDVKPPPAISHLSTIIKNESKHQIPSPSRTIIGANSLERRRRLDAPTATVTANKIRRLIIRRPDSDTPTSMPTLSANTPNPITTLSTTLAGLKPSPASAANIAKSPFLLYMERIYNSVEDERKVEFEEEMIRYAFDWKKGQSSNSTQEI